MKAKRDTDGKFLRSKQIRIDFSIGERNYDQSSHGHKMTNGSSSYEMSHLKNNRHLGSVDSSSSKPLHALSNGHSYGERPRHHRNHRNDQDEFNYRQRFASKRY